MNNTNIVKLLINDTEAAQGQGHEFDTKIPETIGIS